MGAPPEAWGVLWAQVLAPLNPDLHWGPVGEVISEPLAREEEGTIASWVLQLERVIKFSVKRVKL